MSFWRICGLWALLLIAHVLWRTILGPSEFTLDAVLPMPGDRLELPSTLETISGQTISTVSASGRTLVVFHGADCPPSRQELLALPDLASIAHSEGLALRLIVAPGSEVETDSFLRAIPPGVPTMLDSVDVRTSTLRVSITPSAVILDSDGTVGQAFSPIGDWPITHESLVRVEGSAFVEPRTLDSPR